MKPNRCDSHQSFRDKSCLACQYFEWYHDKTGYKIENRERFNAKVRPHLESRGYKIREKVVTGYTDTGELYIYDNPGFCITPPSHEVRNR